MEVRKPLEITLRVREWFAKRRQGEIPTPAVREWMGSVLAEHYRLFYAIALGYLRNATMAEDAVQAAAVKGLQSLKNIREPDSLVRWFATITRNTSLDMLREKSRKPEDPLDAAQGIVAPQSRDYSQIDQQRVLLSEISKLPENQAIVVQLRYLGDLEIDEIAERLGLNRNAVQVRLHRALARLAKSAALNVLRRGTV
jgi:RNA polymerase sigma-70 factor (ECF subfamily)